MLDEAERVYRTLLTRAVRRPASCRSVGALPVMIVAPDLPVGKASKPLRDVAINDGLHLHGVLLVPPRSRLPVPADEHFRRERALYVRGGLVGLDVRPIDRALGCAVDYALKSLARRRFSVDDVLVLPRALSEVR